MVDTQCLKDPINTVQRESPNTLSTDRKDRPDPCSVDRRQHPVALITDGRERPDHLGADGSECGHMLHTVRRDCPDMFSTDMESHHMVGRGMAAIKSLILSNVKEEAEDYMIYQQDPQTQQSIDNLIGMADIRSFILSDVKEEAEECLINHQDPETQLSIDHLIGPGSGAIPAGTLGGKENVGCDPVAVSGMRQNTTDNRTPFQQEIGDEGSNPADQGYGLQTWLMTPFGHPQTDPHKAYNHAHCRSRNIRERSFGLLKARFRCLDLSESIMSGRSKNLSHNEFGGLLWLIYHFLPRMIGTGGRVSKGYPPKERRQRWERVQQQMSRIYHVDRTVHQLKHRWQDVVSREADLLDHLGLEVGGPIGGPPPYTQGEVYLFEDPNATNNMTAEEERAFRIRKTRYSHICQIAKGFRKISCRYDMEKAAKTWGSSVPVKQKADEKDTRASKEMGNGGGHEQQAGPSLAPTPAEGQGTHSSAGQSFGQEMANQDVTFFKLKIAGLELQMATMLRKMDTLQQSVDRILAQL